MQIQEAPTAALLRCPGAQDQLPAPGDDDLNAPVIMLQDPDLGSVVVSGAVRLRARHAAGLPMTDVTVPDAQGIAGRSLSVTNQNGWLDDHAQLRRRGLLTPTFPSAPR